MKSILLAVMNEIVVKVMYREGSLSSPVLLFKA